VRAGHHCAQPLMRRLGVPASSRASFAVHSTHEDVDRLIEGLDKVREVFA
jgi:cysteine desulfurase/selenocysteine lyase